MDGRCEYCDLLHSTKFYDMPWQAGRIVLFSGYVCPSGRPLVRQLAFSSASVFFRPHPLHTPIQQSLHPSVHPSSGRSFVCPHLCPFGWVPVQSCVRPSIPSPLPLPTVQTCILPAVLTTIRPLGPPNHSPAHLSIDACPPVGSSVRRTSSVCMPVRLPARSSVRPSIRFSLCIIYDHPSIHANM